MVLSAAPKFVWILYAAKAGPWHLWTIPGVPGSTNILSPYGAPWFLFYSILSMGGYGFLIASLCVLDLAVSLALFCRSWRFFVFQYPSSFFFLFLAPSDFIVFLFAVSSRLKWPMSLMAFLTKLPFGAPVWVWQFVFTTALALNADHALFWFNGIRYPLLGFWMVWPLESKVFYSFQKKARLCHTVSTCTSMAVRK